MLHLQGTVRMQIRLLGGFAMQVEGLGPDAWQPVRINSRKARGLLAYLALRPQQRESRERLASLLWGDRSDRQARQSLRQCLVELRQVFLPLRADPLLVEIDEIGLRQDAVTVDALEFAAAAELGSGDKLAGCVALYEGEFLAGLELGVEPFDDWVRAERSRLEGLAAYAFGVEAARLDAAGDPRAVSVAEKLVSIDPLREDAQRLLLRMLTRFRSREAALAHAAHIEALLRRELDVEPETETAALIEGIRDGLIAPAPASDRTRDATASLAAGLPEAAARDEGESATASRGSDREAPEPALSSRPGEAARRSRPLVVASAAAAVVVAAAVALSFDAVHAPLSRLSATFLGAAPAPVPDPSWRSPVLAGVAADQKALISQGLYPILVLPFEAGDDGEPLRKLAEQITEDLIGDLARQPTVRVMSAATSRLYRGRDVDVAAVGADLGVRYVLEGKVRQQDAVLRVNVALVDTKSRIQVWTQRFDGDTSNWRDIQDQITRGLARRLHIALAVAAGRPDSQRNDGDAEINELLAEGWRDMFRAPSAGISGEAERRFSAVLERDPDNGRALIGLAGSHLLAVGDFAVHDPARHLALAEKLLGRALDKNPEASIGHYFRGVLFKLQGKREEAQAAFLRTLEINPSHAPAYGQLGHVLIQRGLIEEGFEHLRYAMRLSPSDPLRPYWHLFAVHAEIALGRDAAAFDWARRALDLAPRNPIVHVIMAGLCGMRGDTDCAANHAAEARRLAPALSMERLERRFRGLARRERGERFIKGLRSAFGA